MGHSVTDASEVEEGIDVFIHCEEHLDAHKDEYEAKAVFQVLEVFRYCCEGKIHCAESQNGEDITGEHYEGVATHGEYCWYAVNSKGDIGCLNDDKSNKEGSGLFSEK